MRSFLFSLFIFIAGVCTAQVTSSALRISAVVDSVVTTDTLVNTHPSHPITRDTIYTDTLIVVVDTLFKGDTSHIDTLKIYSTYNVTITNTSGSNSLYENTTIVQTVVADTILQNGTVKIDTAVHNKSLVSKLQVYTIIGKDSVNKDSTSQSVKIKTVKNFVKDSIVSHFVILDTTVNNGKLTTLIIDTVSGNSTIYTNIIDTIITKDSNSATGAVVIDTTIMDTIRTTVVKDTSINNIHYIDTTITQVVFFDTLKSGVLTQPDTIESPTVITKIVDSTVIFTLKLPFFDDFSTSRTGLPPPYPRWLPGGAEVTNIYPYLPPSQNSVTLNGINAKGVPYSTTQEYGNVDSLVSWPIDLSGYSPADSIYLSFYWQEGGYGDPPTYLGQSGQLEDSLTLYFKDTSGIWQPIWHVRGLPANDTMPTTPFYQTLIGLKDTTFLAYFHKNFQFMFSAFGPVFSSRSDWNIDYIIMNTGRTYTDTAYPDITFMQSPNGILKNYTAMPADQFFANPQKELADSIVFSVKNWGNAAVANSSNYLPVAGVNLDLIIDGDTISQYKNYAPFVNALPAGDTGLVSLTMPPLNTLNIQYDTNQVIHTKVRIHTPDVNVSGIDYSMNDTITVSTVLRDYYAYDDGTSENPAIYIVDQMDVAVEYSLNQKDYLTGVSIYFPYYHPSVTDSANKQEIHVVVWDTLTLGSTYEVAIDTLITNVRYSPLDSCLTYNFSSPIALNPGNFYVGLQHILDFTASGIQILIGCDTHNDNTDKTFWKIYNNVGDPVVWVSGETTLSKKGSLMIRPVFANSENTPYFGVTKGVSELECFVYPNPTTGLINILGKVSNAEVYDLTGRLMAEQNFNSTDPNKSMNLQNLTDGLYLVKLSNAAASTVKKIIVTK